MIVTKEEQIFISFVLLEENMRQLANDWEAVAPDYHIQAMCADGLERRFARFQELLAYDNAARRQIQSLFIAGRSTDKI